MLWGNNSMFCIRRHSIILLQLCYPGEEQQLDTRSHVVLQIKKTKKQSGLNIFPQPGFPPFSHVPWFCHIFTVLLCCIPSLAPYLPFSHFMFRKVRCSHSIIISSCYPYADKPCKHNFPSSCDNHKFLQRMNFLFSIRLPLIRPGYKVQAVAWLGFDMPLGVTWCWSVAIRSDRSNQKWDNLHSTDFRLNLRAVPQTHHNLSTLQQ